MITLIVTVIIMLILVSVGVNLTADGDLIGASKTAVNLTNNKVSKEQNRIDGLMEELNNVQSDKWKKHIK